MRKSLEENSDNHPVHPHQAQSERPFSDDSEGIFLQSSSGENVVEKNKGKTHIWRKNRGQRVDGPTVEGKVLSICHKGAATKWHVSSLSDSRETEKFLIHWVKGNTQMII